ncbi:hypothetical protein D3C72_2369340 [compost metagenome]
MDDDVDGAEVGREPLSEELRGSFGNEVHGDPQVARRSSPHGINQGLHVLSGAGDDGHLSSFAG